MHIRRRASAPQLTPTCSIYRTTMILDLDSDEFHEHAPQATTQAVAIPMAPSQAAEATDNTAMAGTSPAAKALMAEDALFFSSVFNSWAEGVSCACAGWR